MQYQIIAVRDIKANCFRFIPLYVHHLGAAIRDFGDQCRDEKSELSKHPEDYELYHLGTWDDSTGETIPVTPHRQIAVGSNYAD